MGNCLVTKLKAVVNNPDLPVLETMQQFTLDAIAASGNSSMTDAQKWALNHFFYQIGAIDNSGIFNKLYYLYMPIICNQNLEKAFVDYKGSNSKGASALASGTAFSGNGVVSGGSDTNVFEIADCSISTDTFSFAIGINKQLGDNNAASFISANAVTLGRALLQANTMGGQIGGKIMRHKPRSVYYGLVGSRRNDEENTAHIITPDGILNDFQTIADAAVTYPTAPFALKLGTTTTPLYIAAVTANSELTVTQEATFASAIRELILAFPDPVDNG